jgi:type I restriction enzyme S subunit
MSLLSLKDRIGFPEDWKIEPIGKILLSSQYGTSQGGSESGVPVIGMKNLQDGKVDFKDLSFVSLNENEKDKLLLKDGDILLNRTNSYELVGKVGFVEKAIEAVFASYLVRLEVDKSKADSKFVAMWLSGFWADQMIKKIATRAISQANVNPTEFKKFCLVPVIPLPEQKIIADLLSTWDGAIEKTERLIQTKEMRFKRLQNDLIYMPTKEGKWQQVRTKSLFKERKETKRGDLPLLSITNGEGVIPREDTNRKDTSNEDKSKYLRICPEDIGYNTMRMWQGVSALSSLEGIVSPAYTICIPGEKLCPLFVAYLFKVPFMVHKFYRYSQGLTSDTWNLKFHHFSEVKMPLPSIDEQEQIAETLSSARREIDLLKQLADKYKTQKRGLMQKMLTGEWRVMPEIVKNFEEAK